MEVAGGRLTEQRFVMLGAGSAGIGIREQLIRTMIRHGLDEAAASAQFYVLDSKGLIHDGRSDLSAAKRAVAQSASAVEGWRGTALADVVHHARPTVLLGATGEPGVFTEAIIREMAAHTERPIIFPMSNPTSRAEAIPADLLHWTDGRALVATGSPFAPVTRGGRIHVIAQSNNSYIFPAIGLAVRATGIRRITDELFMTAAEALKETSPALQDPDASLLPALRNIRSVARHIARAVALEAQAQGLADPLEEDRLERRLDEAMWFPAYRRLVPA
jgi:malate dehydrogenase (oxaloacetate-decarboxylating)